MLVHTRSLPPLAEPLNLEHKLERASSPMLQRAPSRRPKDEAVVVRDAGGHLADIAALLDDGRFADLDVVARAPGGAPQQRFACHAAILAARSAYFDRLFSSGMREVGERCVVLEDCDPGALAAVLRFCYASEASLPPGALLPTLALAERLGLPTLSAACEEAALGSIDMETVAGYMTTAQALRLTRLEAQCYNFLLAHFAEMAETATLGALGVDVVLALLGSDLLRAPCELAVFHTAMAWLKAAPEHGEHAAHVLGMVRFPVMSTAELCRAGAHPVVAATPSAQEAVLHAFVFVCDAARQRDGPALALDTPPDSTTPQRSGSLAASSCMGSSLGSSPVATIAALYRPRARMLAATFCFTGREERWTVPHSGLYRITARGAAAADGAHRAGGRGAIISGLFRLEAGWRLSVLCGGMSRRGQQGNSGGGGGTFVMVDNEDEPLLVAGGGGGTRGKAHDYDGCDGSLHTHGTPGVATDPAEGGAGGHGGSGGCGSVFLGLGGGGGGWRHGGTGGNAASHNGPALVAVRAITALRQANEFSEGGVAGFGGGGGGAGGGGGGGYSGGGGGPGGGGGGSFVHFDALDVTRVTGHDGPGVVEVAFAADSVQELEQGGLLAQNSASLNEWRALGAPAGESGAKSIATGARRPLFSESRFLPRFFPAVARK